MRIVLIHGISNDRPENWSYQWERTIERIIPGQVDEYIPIDWEKVNERKYEPARSARENLLQDLGAITNFSVASHIAEQISELPEYSGRSWIIAHSLGSALAYQALDHIQYRSDRPFFDRLITIGSPLWIPYSRIVKRISCLNIAMPRASKLVNVANWCNIQGRFDVVAGFGLVGVRPATVNWKCWSHHTFESYAKTAAFETALTARYITKW